MKREKKENRGKLRGYIFEVILRRLLELSGYERISTNIRGKVEVGSDDNVQIHGRGTKHQIDLPFVYEKHIPFIFDLRLLGEAKFYSKEVQKKDIRAFIGVVKDISENYFIDDEHSFWNQKRFTDLGVFFSANGFQIEAINLAFAHGIKTISYDNNLAVARIKSAIEALEERYLRASNCISKGKRNLFMNILHRLCEDPSNNDMKAEFESSFSPKRGYFPIIKSLNKDFQRIKSSFFGITESNYYLHFIGNDKFPIELFKESDEGTCRIYYVPEGKYFYLIADGDQKKRKFHFSFHSKLLGKIFPTREMIIYLKKKFLKYIKISININNIERSLILRINEEFLRNLINKYPSEFGSKNDKEKDLEKRVEEGLRKLRIRRGKGK